MGGREPAGVEGVFVRLRLLIKTSLCSDVPLPVLMRIKKPKSVCVWLRTLRVSVCACGYLEVCVCGDGLGVKSVCLQVYMALCWRACTSACVCTCAIVCVQVYPGTQHKERD